MQNDQNRFVHLLKDAGKALLIGLGVAAAVFAVLFAAGFCLHGFAPLAGLDLARRGLFIVGALALLLSAGALLLPEKAASVREKEGWNTRFAQLGLFGAFFCAAVVILAVGALLDALLFAGLGLL